MAVACFSFSPKPHGNVWLGRQKTEILRSGVCSSKPVSERPILVPPPWVTFFGPPNRKMGGGVRAKHWDDTDFFSIAGNTKNKVTIFASWVMCYHHTKVKELLGRGIHSHVLWNLKFIVMSQSTIPSLNCFLPALLSFPIILHFLRHPFPAVWGWDKKGSYHTWNQQHGYSACPHCPHVPSEIDNGNAQVPKHCHSD